MSDVLHPSSVNTAYCDFSRLAAATRFEQMHLFSRMVSLPLGSFVELWSRLNSGKYL